MMNNKYLKKNNNIISDPENYKRVKQNTFILGIPCFEQVHVHVIENLRLGSVF